MSDRLKEIGNRYDLIADGADPDMGWLIAEVERLRKEVRDWEDDSAPGAWRKQAEAAEAQLAKRTEDKQAEELLNRFWPILEQQREATWWNDIKPIITAAMKKAREEAEAELNEYKTLFDLQQQRMKAATRMWQQATNNYDILPDLGNLLKWLMDRIRMNHTTREATLEAALKKAREETVADKGKLNWQYRSLLREVGVKDKYIKGLQADKLLAEDREGETDDKG